MRGCSIGGRGQCVVVGGGAVFGFSGKLKNKLWVEQ